MSDHWRHMLENLPFVLATGQSQHLSMQRIVEAVIIAAVTAAVSVYATTRVLESEVRAMQQAQQIISNKVDDLRDRMARIEGAQQTAVLNGRK